jgi:hypothetical protein
MAAPAVARDPAEDSPGQIGVEATMFQAASLHAATSLACRVGDWPVKGTIRTSLADRMEAQAAVSRRARMRTTDRMTMSGPSGS